MACNRSTLLIFVALHLFNAGLRGDVPSPMHDDGSEQSAIAFSVQGLWRTDRIVSGDREPQLEDGKVNSRAVLILHDRVIDILNVGQDLEPNPHTVTFRGTTRHEGRYYCLLSYPKGFVVRFGKLIIRPKSESQVELAYDVRNPNGSSHRSTYHLSRYDQPEKKLILDRLTKAGIIERVAPGERITVPESAQQPADNVSLR